MTQRSVTAIDPNNAIIISSGVDTETAFRNNLARDDQAAVPSFTDDATEDTDFSLGNVRDATFTDESMEFGELWAIHLEEDYDENTQITIEIIPPVGAALTIQIRTPTDVADGLIYTLDISPSV